MNSIVLVYIYECIRYIFVYIKDEFDKYSTHIVRIKLPMDYVWGVAHAMCEYLVV